MTAKKENKKDFYKDKGFWAKVCIGLGGILAGEAGVFDAIMSIYNYFVGG